MDCEFNEPVLPDDYPVYRGYWYVAGEEPRESGIEGTVADLKRLWGVEEIRRCDAVRRNLLDSP